MAKISELVKTYRLLNDPNAPEWNVKFIGGIAVALALIAAAGAAVWSARAGDELAASPAASAPAPEEPLCSAAELSAEAERLGVQQLPAGHKLPSGCVT